MPSNLLKRTSVLIIGATAVQFALLGITSSQKFFTAFDDAPFETSAVVHGIISEGSIYPEGRHLYEQTKKYVALKDDQRLLLNNVPAYVISLPHSIHRMQRVEGQFKSLDYRYTVVQAESAETAEHICGSFMQFGKILQMAEVAAAISYIKAIQDALKTRTNSSVALVLEDDVSLDLLPLWDAFNISISSLLNELPAEWDIVNMACYNILTATMFLESGGHGVDRVRSKYHYKNLAMLVNLDSPAVQRLSSESAEGIVSSRCGTGEEVLYQHYLPNSYVTHLPLFLPNNTYENGMSTIDVNRTAKHRNQTRAALQEWISVLEHVETDRSEKLILKSNSSDMAQNNSSSLKKVEGVFNPLNWTSSQMSIVKTAPLPDTEDKRRQQFESSGVIGPFPLFDSVEAPTIIQSLSTTIKEGDRDSAKLASRFFLWWL